MTATVRHLFSARVTVSFSSAILFHLVHYVRLIKAMDILCNVHVNIDLGKLIRRAHPDELTMFSDGNSAIVRLLPMLNTCLVY